MISVGINSTNDAYRTKLNKRAKVGKYSFNSQLNYTNCVCPAWLLCTQLEVLNKFQRCKFLFKIQSVVRYIFIWRVRVPHVRRLTLRNISKWHFLLYAKM